MKRTSPSMLCYFTLLSALVSVSCQPEVEEVEVLRPVRTIEVRYGSERNQRTFTGTARTDTIVELSFRASGILTHVNLKVGQLVEKGQLLARLDNVQPRLAQEQAISSLNSAASQLNTAKLSLDRIRVLYEKGSASLGDFESAKNSYRTAEASYESAQRSVDIQREQVLDGFLYAPESGTIASVSVELDENISAGQPVAVLNVGDRMEIEVGLPESVINAIKPGAEARVTFPSLPGVEQRGVVSEVSPSLSGQTATYPVTVAMTENGSQVRSGMSANVTFDLGLGSGTEQLYVPAKAVGEDSEGNFVFLVEPSSDETATVTKRHIQVGELSSAGFSVQAGLEAGQRVAVAGLQTLLDGQRVQNLDGVP